MEQPPVLVNGLLKPIETSDSIIVISDDRAPFIATRHDMVPSDWELGPKWTRHGANLFDSASPPADLRKGFRYSPFKL